MGGNGNNCSLHNSRQDFVNRASPLQRHLLMQIQMFAPCRMALAAHSREGHLDTLLRPEKKKCAPFSEYLCFLMGVWWSQSISDKYFPSWKGSAYLQNDGLCFFCAHAPSQCVHQNDMKGTLRGSSAQTSVSVALVDLQPQCVKHLDLPTKNVPFSGNRRDPISRLAWLSDDTGRSLTAGGIKCNEKFGTQVCRGGGGDRVVGPAARSRRVSVAFPGAAIFARPPLPWWRIFHLHRRLGNADFVLRLPHDVHSSVRSQPFWFSGPAYFPQPFV